MLPIDTIRTDGGTQTRANLNADAVADYAARMQGGEVFPAPVVFHDGDTYWLADGFHRVEAHLANGRSTIDCEVHEGGRLDAILWGIAANAKHDKSGLRRTNADKRQSVRALLAALKEASQNWSDRKIADACGVSRELVGDARAQLSESDSSLPRVGSDGKMRRLPSPPRRTPVPDRVELDALGDERETPEEDLELIEPDDTPDPVVNPEPPPRGWGSVDVSSQVQRIIRASRDYQGLLQREFDHIDPRFQDEVTGRVEDVLLTTLEEIANRLPVDGRRAAENRARLRVLPGGK